MKIEKIFKLAEQDYSQFINRGDDWQSAPPQIS